MRSACGLIFFRTKIPFIVPCSKLKTGAKKAKVLFFKVKESQKASHPTE
jgi:hypothetical protein